MVGLSVLVHTYVCGHIYILSVYVYVYNLREMSLVYHP